MIYRIEFKTKEPVLSGSFFMLCFKQTNYNCTIKAKTVHIALKARNHV